MSKTGKENEIFEMPNPKISNKILLANKSSQLLQFPSTQTEDNLRTQ